MAAKDKECGKEGERDFCKNLDKSGNCCIIDCNGKRTAREVI